MPLALVDLDALDQNTERLLAPVKQAGKRLRLATKSIRCPSVIEHLLQNDAIQGLMCYAASEAKYWVDRGHRNILLGYPTVDRNDLEILGELNERATVAAMVDCQEHLSALEKAGKAIPVVIEIDVSWRPAGLHVGVLRSPIHTVEQALQLAKEIRSSRHLKLHGLMAYEAHIAGVTDRSIFRRHLNAPKRWMKKGARPALEKLRRELRDKFPEVGVFNGGGSGSLSWCSKEAALTEVTAGSGFLDSHLFDAYQDLEGLTPAICFALQVTRRPNNNVITCHGGGYIASGEIGPDKQPLPWLPEGLELTHLEGAGEVQTPLQNTKKQQIALGDPVFFRHAKAGELAEHFNEYLLVRGDKILERAKTYRGEGKKFL